MTRLLAALAASLALVPAAAAQASPGGSLRSLDRVPADPSLPLAHPVDLSGVHGTPRLPDPSVKPRIPDFLKLSERGHAHAADHWTGIPVNEERFRDQHGHVLTLASDNGGVDLTPYANLLASTYHYGEIEFIHVFVTDEARLTEICGSSAAACYAPDDPANSPAGVMVISYEDADIAHAVIHEYGHHIDNNTYNLGGGSSCGIDGDGSRRWFFAREVRDNILDNLGCDPRLPWGQLLPEVFAEDYAQMVGIPRAEFHPAIVIPPPSGAMTQALQRDLDSPFAPAARKVSGRSSRGRSYTLRVSAPLPVFMRARSTRGVRSVSVRGCRFDGFDDVYQGRCRVVVRTKRARARFSFRLVVY